MERVLEELGKKIDLTGQRFGKWTVLRDSGEKNSSRSKLWICRCECGTVKKLTATPLKNGRSSSCGCSNKKDLIGQRFGKWTVIREAKKRNKRNNYWECLCDCGTEREVYHYSLTRGKSKNCGCSSGRIMDHDLTGEVFGNWTIVKLCDNRDNQGKKLWECICECGEIKNVRQSSLLSKQSNSCGCITVKVLTGQRFGKWTVLREAEERDKWGSVYWVCECDCGNIRNVHINSLRSGQSMSCGCSRGRIGDITGQKFGKLTVLEKTNDHGSNGQPLWKCQCDCGGITKGVTSSLISGGKKSCGCAYVSGVDNPRYNPNLTDEERLCSRYQLYGVNTKKWAREVHINYGFTCQKCNSYSKNLNAHHLNAWNAFPEQRFDTANGITLCEACHKDYHHFNGRGNNTLEQFRDHLACLVGEEHVSEIEETLLSRESEIIGQEELEQKETRELQTT